MSVGTMAASLIANVPRLECCAKKLSFSCSSRLDSSQTNLPSTSGSVSHSSSRPRRTGNRSERVRRVEYFLHVAEDCCKYSRIQSLLLHHVKDQGRRARRRGGLLRQETSSSFFQDNDAFRSMLLRSSVHFSHMPPQTELSWKVGKKSERRHHLVLCMAREMGRVGIYKREGNVSLASFGIKFKTDKNGKKVDLTKSLSQMLPYIVTATAASALIHPASFAWVRKDYYAPALGGIMLSIGIQLSVSDFAIAFRRPLPVLVGYIAQYMVKPVLGLLVATAFNVPSAFAAGLILTSCVAGAQLSSYAAFLSEGDTALAIILTSITTITSVLVTPLLTRLFIGSVVPVDVIAMGYSILQVVIFPIMLGLALNTYAKAFVNKARQFMPLVAMVCTSLCIGSPLALNRSQIVSIEGFKLLFPVLAFHTSAFILGYWLPRLPWWRQDERVSKTISLCTGMQSSTLAMLLATQFLGGSHAVPPACSVVVMAVMGLSLGSFWGKGNRVRDLGNSFYTRNEAYT